MILAILLTALMATSHAASLGEKPIGGLTHVYNEAIPAIIPVPRQYTRLPDQDGRGAIQPFKLTVATPIVVGHQVTELLGEELVVTWQGFLRSRMLLLSGQRFTFPLMDGPDNGSVHQKGSIVLRLKTPAPQSGADLHSEGWQESSGRYSLQITPDRVTITAGERTGFLYGLISLVQLAGHEQAGKMGSASTGIGIPCWQITDQPAYGVRGVMLDESRHFFGMQQVKKLLDWMAYYKLNCLHWHLTDEPGWRLQIGAYPKLTTIGAVGNKTDPQAPAKYYTREEIKEVVLYAFARGITVIPEIDMPGHATSANRAYPENSGGGNGKYADFTFNPGRDSTYLFLTNILREVRPLFRVGLVHLGGDEVSFGSGGWGNLPAVKTLMAQEGLQDNKAVEAYFLRRMADSALKFYRKVMTWDEGVAAGLNPASTIIYWWRHDKQQVLERAIKGGYDVVLCPRIPLYFDFVQDSTHQVGRRWGGNYASLRQVFDFDPSSYIRAVESESKTAQRGEMGHVLGLQANLWTETVRTDRRMDFMLFPRIAALASAGWCKAGDRNYSHFETVLKKELAFYKKDGIYYFDPFDPSSTPEPKQ